MHLVVAYILSPLFAMSSFDEDKGSIKSIHSTSLSSESIERPVPVRDHAFEHEDTEKTVAPEVFPLSLRPAFSNNAASIATNETNNPDYEVDWVDDKDANDPKNWSIWYKGFTIFSVSWSTWCIVVYSTSYTTGLADMQYDFHISSESVITLGVTSYRELTNVAGFSTVRADHATSDWHCCRVCDTRFVLPQPMIPLSKPNGSPETIFRDSRAPPASVVLTWRDTTAPISEMYGRRPVYILSTLLFTIVIIPCGLATSLPEVIIVRFFGALAGSAMIANSPGTVNDIVSDDYRALAFSIWSIGPFNGPTCGPIIGGFSTQ